MRCSKGRNKKCAKEVEYRIEAELGTEEYSVVRDENSTAKAQ